MSDNAQTTPLAISLNLFAQRRALDAIQQLGKGLPCSIVSAVGQIVTVKFELQTINTLPNVTVPTAFSFYQMPPWQPGDKGVVLPADAYLGGISGLGGGTADLSLIGNLSALIFVPVANASWTSPNPNAHVIQGPQGVILTNQPSTITLMLNGNSVVIKGSGAALALVTSAFVAFFNAHTHSASGTGPPVTPMTSAQLTTILTAQ